MAAASVSHDLLELIGFLFQLLEPLRLLHAQPAILLLPAVVRRRTDAILAANIIHAHAFARAKDADDLFGLRSPFFHMILWSFLTEKSINSNGPVSGGPARFAGFC